MLVRGELQAPPSFAKQGELVDENLHRVRLPPLCAAIYRLSENSLPMSRAIFNAFAVCALLCGVGSGCSLPGRGRTLSPELVSSRQASQKALSAMDRNDWQTAETLLHTAVETCPTDCEARRLYAEALWRRGDHAQALANIEEALRDSEGDVPILLRVAEMRLATGDSTRALESVERAIDLNPASDAAWTIRGSILSAKGDQRGALADYHRALTLAPSNREVMLRLAETYRTLGEPQRALANLNGLLDTYSPGEEPQDVLLLTGLAYSATNRPEEAIEQFALARERGPATPELLLRMGEAQIAANRTEDARRTLVELEGIQPNAAGLKELFARAGGTAQPGTALVR